MTGFLLRRLAAALLVLLVMSFLVYGLIGLMPGDPIDLMVSSNPNLSPSEAARLKSLYGLDRPLLERYWHWLAGAASGDLGYSRTFNRPVLEVLPPRLFNTLLLMVGSFFLAAPIAVAAGIAAARRPGGPLDGAVNLAAFAGISVPSFWLALLMVMLFAVELRWLPASGMGEGFAERLQHLLLPLVTLTLLTVGAEIRYVRAAMTEAMRQDYVRTARAKGLSERQVLYRHALRNALIPVVTILALDFGTLFSGALVTETIFVWLGMGKTIYDAIMGNDYNLALVALLLATATVLAANLLADLAYAWLDPRIQYR